MKKLFLSFFLASIFACTTVAQEKFVSGGRTRSMIVYAPKNLPENRPLLISMHGANQDAAYQSNQANYQSVADTAKFVVVYPDGEGKMWDISGTKDINFILDIIEEMHKRHKINKNRVYLSGFSMGGMMTYHAATKIADKIAAFAPVSGYPMGGPNATSSRPIPLLHVHGTGDDVCTYSPVQSHIDAWVKRNKCNTTPVTINPYPKGTTSTCTMYRYLNGLNGVEVAHLKLPGKGHWHSNDPAFAMTNKEVWNFCQRFSLVAGPELKSLTPEDNSFDMQGDTHRQFTLQFDKEVVCSNVKATLNNGYSTFTLTLAESGESKTLTFTAPDNITLSDGTYTLRVSGINSQDGGKGNDITASYVYGIEEVGETLKVDTILTQDWFSQQEAIGEGIPTGWTRVNRRNDGTKDEQKSGAANTGGARMKYFVQGGDFDAGFYLSARDYDIAELSYGKTLGYNLMLKKGNYNIEFNSIYWNANAQTSNNTFSFSILKKADNTSVFSEPGLTPSGCMDEKSDRKVTGSQHHKIPFSITALNNYIIEFSMSAGWNGIILGAPIITTSPSVADQYKGGFQRTLSQAKKISETLAGTDADALLLTRLNNVINEYSSFTSISPSEYESATQKIKEAMQPLEATGITHATVSNTKHQMYDLQGRTIHGTPDKGIYIMNGKKIFVK